MSYVQLAVRQDRPIEHEAADRLERGTFVENLIRALVVDVSTADGNSERQATGYVVGLTGKWGLGKSSVLNLLERKLSSMGRVTVATFNPWLFKGRDELLSGFFDTLRTALGRSTQEEVRNLVSAVDRYWLAVDATAHATAAAIDVAGGGGKATLSWRANRKAVREAAKVRPLSPAEERLSLEKKLKATKTAVVVLIDELDRVEDDDVRAVAQLVKAVGDIRGISYLVAYDPDRVIDALGRGEHEDRRRTGELYLEKIIQHPIPLRPLFAEDARTLLTAALEDHGVDLLAPQSDPQREMLNHLVEVIETPREVKRLVGSFAVLEHIVRGEICPYDVLAYSWLLTKAPSLRNALERNIDKIVDDPTEREITNRVVERMNKVPLPTVVDVLGGLARPHEEIIKLLFPRFRKDAENGNGERLSKRRNLVRLLYLGDPPGMIKRTEIEALWNAGDRAETENQLRLLAEAGKLPAIIDRIGDLLPTLPHAGDVPFWVALARSFRPDQPWLNGPNATFQVADDAATVLYRFAMRDDEARARFKTVFTALHDDGDLLLVPWILRKHLFAHGMTKHAGHSRSDVPFSADETRDLLQAVLPRYREAIVSGIALEYVRNLEAVFVIANTRNWDDELRASLTDQLKGQAAVSTFAGLMVPPGHTADRSTFEELCDADALQTEVARVLKDDPPADAWLASSLRRLKAILSGRDPMFLDDGD